MIIKKISKQVISQNCYIQKNFVNDNKKNKETSYLINLTYSEKLKKGKF